MPLDALIAVAVTATVLVALVATKLRPELAFLGGLTALMVTGVLTPAQALAGFANPAIHTIGALYVVVAGLRETGVVHWLGRMLLGPPQTLRRGLTRMVVPVAGLSALMNNTPVVAMLIPAVREWARAAGYPSSKIMIPLSYSAILGGTCTLIGTSTNLVVDGLLIDATGSGLGLFDLAWVGVPIAVSGLAFLLLVGPRLLPDREDAIHPPDDPREYVVEMTVKSDGPLVGKTVEEAGLRNLAGLSLVEIEREDGPVAAAQPEQELRASDRLVFVGIVDSVVELQRIRGLEPTRDQVFELGGSRGDRILVEAVVSNRNPLVGRSVRTARFRSHYGAAVLAVARGPGRFRDRIDEVVLQPGDTLLLETRPAFAERHRHTRDFYLVSSIGDSNPARFERAAVAAGLLVAMVTVAALGWLSLLEAALLAAGGMLIGRALRPESARAAIDWSVLIVIGAAYGVGVALQTTGVAAAVATGLTALAGPSPWANLVAVYLTTIVVTELVTNNAAAVLMFPIAAGVAGALDVSVLPFAVGVMMAASASFATPIGYQTNLMVYGPGGYRFVDFFRIGIPMALVVAAVALLVIPLVWKF